MECSRIYDGFEINFHSEDPFGFSKAVKSPHYTPRAKIVMLLVEFPSYANFSIKCLLVMQH